MVTANLFIVASNYKRSKCPSTGEWINKLHYIWVTKYHSTRKGNRLLIDVANICCCCSVTKLCLTLCGSRDCSMPDFTVLHYLPQFTEAYVHWVSDAIQPSHPLAPPFLLPSIPSIRVFSNESALCIRWPKYWSFSYSISPSSEYSGLISFRIDWFHLLVIQGTPKSLLKHHNLKASILQRSDFFMVQLSQP